MYEKKSLFHNWQISFHPDLDVHGKVIHVVHRPPPSSRTQTSSSETPPTRANGGGPHMNNVVVGSFTLPSDILDPNQVQVTALHSCGSVYFYLQ